MCHKPGPHDLPDRTRDEANAETAPVTADELGKGRGCHGGRNNRDGKIVGRSKRAVPLAVRGLAAAQTVHEGQRRRALEYSSTSNLRIVTGARGCAATA